MIATRPKDKNLFPNKHNVHSDTSEFQSFFCGGTARDREKIKPNVTPPGYFKDARSGLQGYCTHYSTPLAPPPTCALHRGGIEPAGEPCRAYETVDKPAPPPTGTYTVRFLLDSPIFLH